LLNRLPDAQRRKSLTYSKRRSCNKCCLLSFTESKFMSESVVCNACGSANRAKAKFCTGCARPLPGFEPSGSVGLDRVMSLRPSSEAPVRDDGSVPVLPAETAAFWLKAGYWGLAMIVGFTLWCLYVTNKPGAPPLKTEIMSLLAPVIRPSSDPSSPAAPDASSAPAGESRPAAAPPDPATSPIHALLPGRAGVSAEMPRPPAERPLAASSPQAEARTPTKAPKRSASASRANRERLDEPSASWTEPTPAPARRSGEPDPGPPIVAGPGPLYDYSRLPAGAPVPTSRDPSPARQAVPDPGPPIIPGPGPRYEGARLPAQASAVPSNDPGPPIAVGPGPLVNYSTRGAGAR
jgi:hypothetical protein